MVRDLPGVTKPVDGTAVIFKWQLVARIWGRIHIYGGLSLCKSHSRSVVLIAILKTVPSLQRKKSVEDRDRFQS